MALLEVKGLTVSFRSRYGEVTAVDNVNFSVAEGETLAIVGESGSGKSVTCYSLLQLLPRPPARIEAGTAYFGELDLLQLDERRLRTVRGREIAMVFQDPMTSLNPYLSIGSQLIEPLQLHHDCGRREALQKAVAALEEVGIDRPHARINDYPHQLSGGMRQRVMIAMALIAEPRLLIADEPTTALDVTVQAQILQLLKRIQQQRQLTVIFISHDLAVVAEIADRVLVMRQGQVVESGSCIEVLQRPQQQYTRDLLAAVPRGAKQNTTSHGAPPLLRVSQLSTWFTGSGGSLFGAEAPPDKAVDGVSFEVGRGEIVGLVGESGSGKSTTGRSVLQLLPQTAGLVEFDGVILSQLKRRQMQQMRRRMQMIFQDPYASLNPRMPVYECLAEPLLHHRLADRSTVMAKVLELMDDVGLARASIRKYPHEFSGGQRQRIAIGRAIATRPDFIVADEPVSALDVTIQSQILELLLVLVEEHNLSMLFISHDLAVVRKLCDRVLVMQAGKLVEAGAVESVYSNPQHPYTKTLLAALPRLAAVQ